MITNDIFADSQKFIMNTYGRQPLVLVKGRGTRVYDLGMGNPDQGTPKHVVDKLVEAARNPKNHRYSASKGITELRSSL